MSTAFVEDVAPGPNSGLIEVLSYRTYPSLVSALREVVSNSSDADASKLNITLSRTYDTNLDKNVWKLTFFDDGEGMTLDEFRNYLRLSGLGRRDRSGSDATPSGRPIIGMLGIGSLAIAPWADRVEILTKKRGSSQVLHVQIPYAKFFNNPDIRSTDLYGETGQYKYSHRSFELDKPEVSEVENGFTIIDLIGMTDEAINELIDPAWHGDWPTNDLGLLGEKYHEYLASTKKRGRLSFRKFPPLLRFMHRLALLIPVPYPASTPVQLPPISTMVRVLSAQCMDAITVQGVKLQRPMLILDQQTEEDRSRRSGSQVRASQSSSSQPQHQGSVIPINEMLPKSGVQIRGYIWGQNTQLKFQDLAGIQVRIKNVGIGPYNFALFDPAQELDSRSSTRAARAQAVSGEIFIDYSKELERALRGDREGFQESSPVYIELKTAVYKHVQKMYQKIDSLAPSRQNPTVKGQSKSEASQGATTQDTAAPPVEGVQTSITLPSTLVEDGGSGTLFEASSGQQGATTEVPLSIPIPPISSDPALAIELIVSPEQVNSTEGASGDVGADVTPPSSVSTEAASTSPPLRSYTVSRSTRPTSNVGLTELADASVTENNFVVTIRGDLLPPGLTAAKIEQVCTVAATLAVVQVAQENQTALTVVDVALALQLENVE